MGVTRAIGRCYTRAVDDTALQAQAPTDTVLTGRSRLLTVLGVGIGVCTLYGAVGVYTARGPFYQLETALDRAVPMTPAWVLVYLMIFFQAAAPLASVRDTRVLRRAIGAYLTLYATALPLWLWFPVTVPRPPLPITDLWTYGVALTRFIDPPSNCMPSMHVALSVMAALVVRRIDVVMGRVLLASAALVTWSTVALEQHWVADGLVAILLALIADHLWFRRSPLPPEALSRLPRVWHATWIGTYAVVALVLMSGWWFGWMPLEMLPPNTERW